MHGGQRKHALGNRKIVYHNESPYLLIALVSLGENHARRAEETCLGRSWWAGLPAEGLWSSGGEKRHLRFSDGTGHFGLPSRESRLTRQ
ncbi:hypothetical protein RRG08_009617 [Elysia crispata]|uniref:Uncharacterized protein n=1 Tax=Elysia crispata TaxID=231223 RepID=A0AAE1CM29_9GAST|nr:hypothetical protein RRG08_009617 [Elysia crispata]